MGVTPGDSRGPRAVYILLLLAVIAVASAIAEETSSRASSSTRNSRGLFAPRVEYDEWTPLGHGDPLKNDPTYDYVPPVLERVRYWLEPPSRSSPPRITPTHPAVPSSSYTHPTNTHPHTTFLQTTSLDSRRDTYPFLTLVDAPQFNRPSSIKTPPPHHYLPRPHYSIPPPPYRTLPPSQPLATPPPQILTPAPSVAPTVTITTPSSALTTDPLFAHYKQPAEPLRGPMYLIIEGHSKVKTYGASKTVIPRIRVHSEDSRRQRLRRRRRKLRKRSLL